MRKLLNRLIGMAPGIPPTSFTWEGELAVVLDQLSTMHSTSIDRRMNYSRWSELTAFAAVAIAISNIVWMVEVKAVFMWAWVVLMAATFALIFVSQYLRWCSNMWRGYADALEDAIGECWVKLDDPATRQVKLSYGKDES